ncbi:bacteriocin [Weissella muntiaci]|uniref:Bacteriocin n=1 Tax=Weissella muntiaci TaxID=2508881 RepID=A0A6C2CAG2_9LACO|nr:bacteriocin [Weissella muntiaci]TYC50566.1 bacteriocin [Weissella muntiaci]
MGLDKLNKFESLTETEMSEVEGGTILGYLAGYVVGRGGVAWGSLPGHHVSAINN